MRSIVSLNISSGFVRGSVIPILLAMIFGVQNLAAQDSSAETHASLGLSLARVGKLLSAEQELREAVRIGPMVASYRAQLGSILGLEGKWQEALESFQKAIELAPESLDFRRETAAVQWQLGLMPPAEANLQYVLAREPNDSGAILLLGLVREKSGDYTSAVRLLESQFELVISHPDRTVALFRSIEQSGQREKIQRIVDVLKQRSNDKQWANAIAQCTQIAAAAGDLPTSRMLFALIPEDDPGRLLAGIQLAHHLYSRAQVSQARELLLQMAERGVVNADLEALLGNCFEAERRPELAVQAYQRAIKADPSRIDYYEDLISLFLYLHKTNDAMALANHATEIAPNDARAWVWKGNVNVHSNAYQDAMTNYRQAGKLDSSNADAMLGLAVVYFVTGQSDAAIAEYKTGIARFPNDARFYVACAEMLLASPDSATVQAEAERLLHKAVTLAPQSAETHYQLGQLAMQQKRLKDAETEFLLSLQSDPDRSKTHFALSSVYRRMGQTKDAASEFTRYQDLKHAEESGTTAATSTVANP